MNTVSVLAAGVSLASALVTVVLGAVFERRRTSSERRARLRHRSRRYSEPLLQAATAVRSRLGNAHQFAMFRDADERFRDYAVYESLYRVGRYLCVVHLLWREVRFLDFGGRRHNKELIERVAAVRSVLNDYSGELRASPFLVLGGEQEAIGELMIDPASDEAGPPRCLSYPDFRERLDDDPRFARWLGPLEKDIRLLVTTGERPARFVPLEPALDQLIKFLDRHRVWRPWNPAASTPAD